MKIFYSFTIAIVLLAGCATQVGKTSFPEPTASFSPKKTYPTTSDALWNASLSALEKNRIPTTSTDKSSGVIQTDYIEGQSSLIGLGLVAAQSTRYKFNLTLRKQGEAETRLTILAKVEDTMKGESGASPWTDVSRQNPALVTKLENWLYEQVEKELGSSK